MTKAIIQANNAMKAIERSGKLLFASFLITIVALASSYIYFVNRSVFNTVEREKVESNIMTLQTKLGQTEREYMSELNKLTLERAESMGFVASTGKVIFVSAQVGKGSVAMR